MRSPLAAMRCESPVNKLSVSPSNVIAVPLDNRNVLLFDLNGLKLARLPRSNRMVCIYNFHRLVMLYWKKPLAVEIRLVQFKLGYFKISLRYIDNYQYGI